jgi:elongation factor Ts
MKITAQMVKELRERTGAGMMDCKKALNESGGDLDAAAEQMRKTGLAKADKKAGRVAAEGVVAVKSDDCGCAAMVEVNCETDFVSRGDDFQAFADAIANRVLASKPANLDALLAMPLTDDSDTTVEKARQELIATIGENMSVRRFVLVESGDGEALGVYRHGNAIAVLTKLNGGDVDLARDIAMHIAASRPSVINQDQVDAEAVAKEKSIFVAQAAASGKPDNIIEKMVSGRIRKFLDEQALVGQPFVKDPDMKVGKLLSSKGAEVLVFERMEVGEGIEKKVDDFAAEVAAQVAG